MPQFPQPVYDISSGLDANTTAAAGGVYEFAPTASRTLTLPPVSSRGPVTVKLQGTFGAGFTVKVVPGGDGSTIDGFGSITLGNVGDLLTVASDGTNWWVVGKSHNTHDTY